MKKLLIFLLSIISTTIINAQVITPSIDAEYCPNTEYTFSVTLPAAYQSINTQGGVLITQPPYNFANGNTTFDFKAKFADVNQDQTFHIAYSGSSFDPVFTKVKSLFNGHCSVISNSTISAPLCQTTGIPYSFTALQWKNNSTSACFGTISTYDYQLPANWKLNGISSTGSNWLHGSNSVTFTPDAGTGGVILVHATNANCSAANVTLWAGFLPFHFQTRPNIFAFPNICTSSMRHTNNANLYS